MPKDKSFKPLKVLPIPVPKGNDHPPIEHPQLMDHEFTLGKDHFYKDDYPQPQLLERDFSLGLIAPKGCGKTTMICNLLMFYKKYFHTILVFSPTINSVNLYINFRMTSGITLKTRIF